MLAVKTDRRRNVPHLFARIPVVGLHQHRLQILCRSQTDRIVKHPLGPVADLVFFRVAGQWFAEARVMCRQITVPVHQYCKKELIVRVEIIIQLLLDMEIGIGIIGGMIFLRQCRRNLDIVGIEELAAGQIAFCKSLRQYLAHGKSPFARQFFPLFLNLLFYDMPQCFCQPGYVRHCSFGFHGAPGDLMSHFANFVHCFGYLLAGSGLLPG